MEDRAAVVADVVEHQTLLRVDARTERPAVPGDARARDDEADPLGLADLERAQILARRHDARAVVAVGRGDRLVVDLLDGQHPPLVEVHEGDQALDRPRVAVVARLLAQVAERTGDAPPRLQRMIEGAGRADHDVHLVQLGDAAPSERGGE